MKTILLFISVFCITVWSVSGEEKGRGQVVCKTRPCDPEGANIPKPTSVQDQREKSQSSEDKITNTTNFKSDDQNKENRTTGLKLNDQKKENETTGLKLDDQKKENETTSINLDDQKKENESDSELPEFYKLLLTSTKRVYIE